MNPSWAAVAAGAIGLAVLDGVVSRSAAANNVGGWLAGAGKAVEWFLSPAVPAFSSSSTTASTTATTASTPTAQVAVAGPPASLTPPGSSAASQPTGGFPGESLQTIAQGGAV